MKKQLVKYFVTVHTSDISHAGTDADVLVELKGPNGTMGWTALPEQRGDPFGRGKVSEFTIEGTDVGEQIDKCSVKTEGKKWHCALIEVRHERTGETFMFPCDEWISEDAAKERVLLAGVGVEGAAKKVAKGQRKYVVTTCLLYTSPSPRDQRGSRMPSSA